MFFVLSKVLWFFLTPSNLLVTLCVAGVVLLLIGWRRTGLTFAALGALGLLIFGFSPTARLLLRQLEDRFPAVAMDDPRPVDGVIILGGSAELRRGQIKLNDAAARTTTAVALARRYPEARIVFSGGDGNLVGGVAGASEADAMRLLLRQMGLEGERVIIEGRSRNTRENAAFTRDLVQPGRGERWLLVTSAFHMPRSVAVFRHERFRVTPYPVDFHSRGSDRDWLPFNEAAEGLRLTDRVVREYIGIFAYWLAGYTSELWPEPLE